MKLESQLIVIHVERLEQTVTEVQTGWMCHKVVQVKLHLN